MRLVFVSPGVGFVSLPDYLIGPLEIDSAELGYVDVGIDDNPDTHVRGITPPPWSARWFCWCPGSKAFLNLNLFHEFGVGLARPVGLGRIVDRDGLEVLAEFLVRQIVGAEVVVVDLPLLGGTDVGEQFLVRSPDLIQLVVAGTVGVEGNSWHALVLDFLGHSMTLTIQICERKHVSFSREYGSDYLLVINE